MNENTWLADRFDAQRPRLRSVAYRMLGSLSEAEDAIQEAWLRLSRSAEGEIEDLGAWLTTVVTRIALNMLRTRRTRSETHVPDPILDRAEGPSPEHAALLASNLGLALLVVLETLPPNERVAFVLHDVFGLPFEQIGPILERTPEAARQLASRARRRVQERNPSPDADLTAQHGAVAAFMAASQSGDLHGLLAVLHPDVVLRSDAGAAAPGRSTEVRGATEVARRAQLFSRLGLERRLVLVNGTPGLLNTRDGKPFSVMAFAIHGSQIVAIDILADAERIARLDLAALEA